MKTFLRSLGWSALVASCLAIAPAGCAVDATGDDTADATEARARFETFAGVDGQYYFQLIAGNGEKLLRSEGYTTLAAAKKGITSVKANGATTKSFKIFTAKSGEHYFNLLAKNGEVVATSETYVTKASATTAVATVAKLVGAAEITGAISGAGFESFRGSDGQYYFHLKAKNGEVVLQSEGYTTSAAAKKSQGSVQAHGTSAARFTLLDAQNGQAYFHITAVNGQIIARSQMYTTRAGAERGALAVRKVLSDLGGVKSGDADVKKAVEAAANGLLYTSESDYPYTWVQATLGAGDAVNEATVRAKLATYVDSDPDTDKPLAKLAGMTRSWSEFRADEIDGCTQGGNDDAYCAKVAKFMGVIENNLSDIHVFYFGENGTPGHVDGVAVSVIIVGRTASGNLAGVRTIAIWT
jgi:uncharacterized protein